MKSMDDFTADGRKIITIPANFSLADKEVSEDALMVLNEIK